MQKMSPFPEQVVSQFLWLESVDQFKTNDYFSGGKKLSLYANEACDEHEVYFRRWLKRRALFIKFLM